jgi:hypothetical protein
MKIIGTIRDTFAQTLRIASSRSATKSRETARFHAGGVSVALAFVLSACGGAVTSEVDAASVSGAGAASPSGAGGTGGIEEVGAAGGGDGGGGANAWTPESLGALALWLDGSQGVEKANGAVVYWVDQSGYHNDAQPLPGISGAPMLAVNAFGGKPAVRFNGTSDYLVVKDNSSLQFGTGDFVVAVAARHTTLPDAESGVGFFYAKPGSGASPSGGPMLYGNTEAHTTEAVAQLGLPELLVKTTEGNLNNGQPMVLVMRRMALAGGPVATLSIRLNGAGAGHTTGESTLCDVSAVGQPIFIGGSPQMQYLVGDIAEIIVNKGPTSDEDVAAIETYLMTKYGI